MTVPEFFRPSTVLLAVAMAETVSMHASRAGETQSAWRDASVLETGWRRESQVPPT
jgi:hypothetical protein